MGLFEIITAMAPELAVEIGQHIKNTRKPKTDEAAILIHLAIYKKISNVASSNDKIVDGMKKLNDKMVEVEETIKKDHVALGVVNGHPIRRPVLGEKSSN